MTQIQSTVKRPQEKMKPYRMRVFTLKRSESRKNPKMTQASVPVIAERKEANALDRTVKYRVKNVDAYP
jgi:hypothetical protein